VPLTKLDAAYFINERCVLGLQLIARNERKDVRKDISESLSNARVLSSVSGIQYIKWTVCHANEYLYVNECPSRIIYDGIPKPVESFPVLSTAIHPA
jgi:hypothetical protein